MSDVPLPPIERSISVSWDPAAAFRRFTSEFSTWWPVKTHSIGGPRVQRIVFERRVDGLIFEEHVDGRRFQWGQVLVWDPPRLVRFTWHPAKDASTAQEVEVRFEPAGSGTRVVLVASHWERWGKGAKAARKGYDIGWGYVLNVWAERRTGSMRLIDGLGGLISLVQWLRGGRRATIARAGGEILQPSAPRA
ncbi:MAG: SRPBCC domain-containing protein [Planctomycetes bacterium]|nr:SRPBCC domain-containing protein [Planctomycetota bacterium]